MKYFLSEPDHVPPGLGLFIQVRFTQPEGLLTLKHSNSFTVAIQTNLKGKMNRIDKILEVKSLFHLVSVNDLLIWVPACKLDAETDLNCSAGTGYSHYETPRENKASF